MKLDDRGRSAAEGMRAAVSADAGSPADTNERFQRYRRRKDRTRRVGTIVVAATISIAVMVVLTRAFTPGRSPRPATPAPAQGRIIFGRFGPQHALADWFLVDLDSPGPRDLDVTTSCATWWPDGSKLLITDTASRVSGQPIRPATILADGSGYRSLDATPTDLRLNLGCGDVSPDGDTIALEGFRDRRPELKGIYAVRASDGGGLTRLTHGDDAVPVYAPSGREIVFTRYASGGTPEEAGALFVMNSDGSGAHRITEPGTATLDKAWSPDGRWIVFQKWFGMLFLIQPNGQGLHQIPIDLPEGSGAFYPTWSPDGSRIAFSIQGEAGWDIYTVRPDGSGLRQVTNTPWLEESAPDWGPPAG